MHFPTTRPWHGHNNAFYTNPSLTRTQQWMLHPPALHTNTIMHCPPIYPCHVHNNVLSTLPPLTRTQQFIFDPPALEENTKMHFLPTYPWHEHNWLPTYSCFNRTLQIINLCICLLKSCIWFCKHFKYLIFYLYRKIIVRFNHHVITTHL